MPATEWKFFCKTCALNIFQNSSELGMFLFQFGVRLFLPLFHPARKTLATNKSVSTLRPTFLNTGWEQHQNRPKKKGSFGNVYLGKYSDFKHFFEKNCQMSSTCSMVGYYLCIGPWAQSDQDQYIGLAPCTPSWPMTRIFKRRKYILFLSAFYKTLANLAWL